MKDMSVDKEVSWGSQTESERQDKPVRKTAAAANGHQNEEKVKRKRSKSILEIKRRNISFKKGKTNGEYQVL